jgi:hypothetical protein
MHMTQAMPVDDVSRALTKLRSLHDGDLGVIDAVACGVRAIPALRETLFAREPSGLYDVRRRAVEALAQLHADYVLIDYLRAPHHVSDPVEQTGEDAVVNAAARALGASSDPRALSLLLDFARDRPLAGVIEALGRLGRAEALPYFIRALAEDDTRLAAEAAIRNLGPRTRSALLDVAARRIPTPPDESESSRRQRRSALRVFSEFGAPPVQSWPALIRTMHDEDFWIAVNACDVALAHAQEPAISIAAQRLIDLLGGADWLLAEQIEDSLLVHYDAARPAIERYLAHAAFQSGSDGSHNPVIRVLREVLARQPFGRRNEG